jgi:hypothetical protein
MALWLIEGLPGAGKSSMAEYLCVLARESGYEAAWYLEESADHPVHPRSLKTQRRTGEDFIEVCLHSWSRFTDNCQKDSVVHILEGSAFQSTVRFMMEERLTAIEDYYQRFEKIVRPLNPRMVYLRTQNPHLHSQYVSRLRGKGWSTKVSSYLEKTQYSQHKGLSGLVGMHQFWTDYAALCDELAARANMPTKVIDIVPGDWERHRSEAAEFFDLKSSSATEELRFNTKLDTDTLRAG